MIGGSLTGRNRWWTVRVSPRRTSTHTQLALVQDPNESIGGGWPGRSPLSTKSRPLLANGQPRDGQVEGYRGGHRTEYASIHVLASSSVLKERTYCCTPRGSVIRTHQLESSSWIGSNLGKRSPTSIICGLRANRASGGNYLRGG